MLGLDDVYHAPWFLVLLVFLTLSTSICVWKNTPLMVREWSSFKEHYELRQLKALPAWTEVPLDEAKTYGVGNVLQRAGYRWRGTLGDKLKVSGKRGLARRLGYVLTHVAIVVISVGGLIDGNPRTAARRMTGDIVPAAIETALRDVDKAAQLEVGSGAFRGALRLSEGSRGDVVTVGVGQGYVVQKLPFAVRLKSFHVDYHQGGRPKDFVSLLEVEDPTDPKVVQTVRISMNNPAAYRNLSFYQSGFDDGGSSFNLRLWADAVEAPTTVAGQVGLPAALLVSGQPYSLNAQRFHPRTVVSTDEKQAAGLGQAFLSGPKASASEDLGPRLELILRDSAGQAIEQTVYLSPIRLEGRPYHVVALKSPDAEAIEYVRLPLDQQASTLTYVKVMALLFTSASQSRLLERLTAGATDRVAAKQLQEWLRSYLGRYRERGFEGSADGEDPERRRAALELLSRVTLLAWQEVHPQAEASEAASTGLRFVADALLAYSQWVALGRVPLSIEGDVKPQMATVLQVTYSPGAPLVYLGMAMLAVGVVLLVLMQERRVFVRASRPGFALVALSANSKVPGIKDELASLTALICAGSTAAEGLT